MDPKQHDGGRGLIKTSAPAALYSRPVSFEMARFENHHVSSDLAEFNETHRLAPPTRLFAPTLGLLD
jgi:hypothetical protein